MKAAKHMVMQRQYTSIFCQPLPTILREHFFSKHEGNTALLLDALAFTKLQPGQRYNRVEIIAALRAAGITASDDLIWQALQSIVFMKRERVYGRGRPTIYYLIPSVDSLIAHYHLKRLKDSDPVEKHDLAGLHSYRVALYRGFIARLPGNHSRIMLGERLGVGRRTTVLYDKLARIQVTPRIHERLLPARFDEALEMVAAAVQGKQWLKLRASFIDSNGVIDERPERPLPALPEVYKKVHGKGQFFLCTQLTNHYQLQP